MGEPIVKRIVVLANSVKRNHRCVAGKELFGEDGNWTPGLWTRPVDPAHEGAITLETMRCADGQPIKFLDIVDVPILSWANDPNHPEDWVVDTSRQWVRQGTLPLTELSRLLDHPVHLWKGWMDDRIVRGGYVGKMMQPASLYFIKPEGEVKVCVYWDEEKMRVRKRLRLRHGGQDHEFDITDPQFESHYPGLTHSKDGPPTEIPLEADGRLHLCLSLTPEFHGAHYKIAATIWEAPPA
jgi:hypothetical protein